MAIGPKLFAPAAVNDFFPRPGNWNLGGAENGESWHCAGATGQSLPLDDSSKLGCKRTVPIRESRSTSTLFLPILIGNSPEKSGFVSAQCPRNAIETLSHFIVLRYSGLAIRRDGSDLRNIEFNWLRKLLSIYVGYRESYREIFHWTLGFIWKCPMSANRHHRSQRLAKSTY
jgi:hypothetical protein